MFFHNYQAQPVALEQLRLQHRLQLKHLVPAWSQQEPQ
jgi:hypothetical protein